MGWGCLRDLEYGVDQCAARVRLYLQSSAQLPQALSHAAKSEARSGHLPLFFFRNASSKVPNLNGAVVAFLLNTNDCGGASRVTVNVRQTFLNDTEDSDFHFRRQAAEIVRNYQIDINLAALRETIHVPAQSRSKTRQVEKRGVKEMGNGANLTGNLLHQHGIIRNRACRPGIEQMRLRLHDAYVHADRSQQLPDAVMQLASNALAFFVLHILQARGEFHLLFLDAEVGD